MLESSKVPALTRAIDILNLIARIGPCSAATIIDTLGIPKSTAYLLLNELSIRRSRAAGKAAGFLAVAPGMAQQCLAWGANFVAVGVDSMLYSHALDKRLAMSNQAKMDRA